MSASRVPYRTRLPDRVVQRFRSNLVSEDMHASRGYQIALKYAKHQRGYRLGRNVVTNPFVFSSALRVADRAARHAQERFHSFFFRMAFALLPERLKKRVMDEYRAILKTAAALHRIQARDILQHHQTPSVYDKRAFTALLRESLQNGLTKPFSLIMVDLDDFKQVNSNFGHGVGDAVLNSFSNGLALFAKLHRGYAGRVGGEEFQIYLPLPPSEAQKRLDAFRNQFRDETHEPSFIKRSGVQVVGDITQWRKGITFTAGIAGTSAINKKIIDLKPIFGAIQKGLKVGKAREGKSTSITIDLPWKT